MRSILKWMLILVLLLAVVAAGGGYWFYIRSDEMLRETVLAHLQSLAPELKFDIEQANFDFRGRIRLQGISIRIPEDSDPAFSAREMVVTLDEYNMTNFENVAIQRLRLVDPHCRLVQKKDGRWNWQGIAWHFVGSPPVPEITLEHGQVDVEFPRGRNRSRKLTLTDFNVSAIPSASRKLTAVVSARIEPAGPLTATIEANLDGPPASIEAKWLRLPVDDDLIDLIGELSPTVAEKVDQAKVAMAKLAAVQNAASSIRKPEASPTNPSMIRLQSQLPAVSPATPSTFGLKCSCDLHCRLKWDGPQAPLQYQLLTEVRDGQLSNLLLPFPLYEIQGSVFVSPGQVLVRGVSAENGETRIEAETRAAANQSPQIRIQVKNVQIDDALKARVPESLRKLLNSIGLTGVCDADLWQNPQTAAWEVDLKVHEGTVTHEKFKYPVREVGGTVRVRGNRIDIEGEGRASGVPVKVSGWVVNPGPANQCDVLVQADGIPINSMFINALPEGVRKALVELNLQGAHDLRLRCAKAAGEGQKYRLNSAIRLQDCSCMLRCFPYRIHRLNGYLTWDEDSVVFKELTGQHDETRLRATGRFLRALPGRLELAIHADDAAFDRSLEAAVPASLQRVWQEFQPSGRFDLDTQITWVPGRACQVTLPRIKVIDGQISMRSFPWPMTGINGEFSYDSHRLEMVSLSAQHDDTQIRGRGAATFVPGESWRVRFDELHVDDLIPNSTFRKALPPQLRRAFETLDPVGKFSMATARQGRVEVAGGDGAISSAWDIQVLLAGCSLTTGVRIEDVHGRIDLKGGNDGKVTNLNGQLDLDSISVFRQASGLAHQITHVVGPFSLQNEQFVGGVRAMAMPNGRQSPPQVTLADRISGDFLDGKLTLDVVADLRGEPDYRLQLTMSRGRLESYAQQYLRGQSNLAGIMNGWLYLWGQGRGEEALKGKGQLEIAPAALYELPLFVQIFRALRLDAADRTAFDHADMQYHIDNSRFTFDTIDLVGNAISLRGRGYVRFDGAMQFDFYSMLARNQIRIPIIHEIAGALSRGWVGVKVSGSVGEPKTEFVAVPEFDEAMKRFLGSFEQTVQPRQAPLFPRFGRPAE